MKQHLLLRAMPALLFAAIMFISLWTLSPIPDTAEKKQERVTQIQEEMPSSWMDSINATVRERLLDPAPERAEKILMTLAFALLAGGVWYIASGFIKTIPPLLLLAFTLFAGMVIRTLCLTQYENTDYLYCLAPWVQSFRETGWKAIIGTWSDYTMPYLYIVGFIAETPLNDLYLYKLVSVIFDCAIVIAGLRLARVFRFGGNRKGFLAAALFLVPTFWLNSSYWGQCDSIYAFFCLLSLALVLEDRPVLSVVSAALAFSFKLQAIFFLPVFIIIWIAKRVTWWREIPVFIGTFFMTILPAWLMGRPLVTPTDQFGAVTGPTGILSIYVKQTSQYSARLNLNSPSMYALLWTDENHDIFFNVGLLLAFLFLGTLVLIAWLNRDRLNRQAILLFAAAMVIGIPWFLPSMHDRYFYLADMFCVVLAVFYPNKWYLGPFCVFSSYAGYYAFLFNNFLPWVGLVIPSLIMLFLLGTVVYMLLRALGIGPAPDACMLAQIQDRSLPKGDFACEEP